MESEKSHCSQTEVICISDDEVFETVPEVAANVTAIRNTEQVPSPLVSELRKSTEKSKFLYSPFSELSTPNSKVSVTNVV